MADYDNTNRGALFKNDRHQGDSDPEYKGSLNVGGVEYWLNAWINVSKAGAKYMSLSVRPKQQEAAADRKPAMAGAPAEEPKLRSYAQRRDDPFEDL